MIPLGISSAAQAEFSAALLTAHSIKVTVQILDLEHRFLSDVSDKLIDGQVNYLADSTISRSLTLSLLDPDRSMHFDSDSPSEGALYLDRMIQVIYSVHSPTMDDWVDVPVFAGPVIQLDRADDVVNVECQSKEALAWGQAWNSMTVKKGTPKVDAIRLIMRNRAGETRFDLPDMVSRLPKDVSLGRESRPWAWAQQIARSMDRQLFYDGRGVCRMRRFPGSGAFTFRAGGALKGRPSLTYTMENLYNIVLVKGAPKAGTGTNDYVYAAPSSHPLSPTRLGRNGVNRYLLEVVEDSTVRSKTEARTLARSRLNDHLLQSVDVQFECLPVPHLEPMDLGMVVTDEFAMSFRFRAASLPLTAGGSMTVGYLRKVSQRRRR